MRHDSAQAISSLDRPERTLYDVAVAAALIFLFLCMAGQCRILGWLAQGWLAKIEFY
jgi:hypothetical protein